MTPATSKDPLLPLQKIGLYRYRFLNVGGQVLNVGAQKRYEKAKSS